MNSIRLKMSKKKSLLFVRPDYHCSFAYRDELRKLGWKVDIYVPWSYPDQILYSEDGIIRPPKLSKFLRQIGLINSYLADLWFIFRSVRYRYHVYYGGSPEWFSTMARRIPETWSTLAFRFSRFCGSKLIYLPTGCLEELSKAEFSLLDSGAVCNNCGFWDRCDDTINLQNFERVRKYFHMAIGVGVTPVTQYHATHLRWKSLDLDLWSPELAIPKEHRLAPTKSVRVLHSFASGERHFEGRNIKGSPIIRAAVERLQSEGHDVEFMFLSGKKSRDMRFYQVQADIIVEQLRYGWWGSTGVETMALGKPVICYLRPAWKDLFLTNFPEYQNLPIVEATVDNFYEVLKHLLDNPEQRAKYGESSRKFAIEHFDPGKNAVDFSRFLLELK